MFGNFANFFQLLIFNLILLTSNLIPFFIVVRKHPLCDVNTVKCNKLALLFHISFVLENDLCMLEKNVDCAVLG